MQQPCLSIFVDGIYDRSITKHCVSRMNSSIGTAIFQFTSPAPRNITAGYRVLDCCFDCMSPTNRRTLSSVIDLDSITGMFSFMPVRKLKTARLIPHTYICIRSSVSPYLWDKRHCCRIQSAPESSNTWRHKYCLPEDML